MSGGGGSGSDGGGDMQVSGAEAAVSKEKGISTYADTKVQHDSFTRGSDTHGGNQNDNTPVYQSNYANQDLETQQEMDAQLGADTSTVGIAAPDTNYSQSEIEKGYTDEGVKLDQVGAGKYMTKEQQYNTGLIEKDPKTGEDVQGRYRVNENTGELERTDMSFAEHWKNAPGALKYSPTLRLLYAGGKNIGEWMSKKGFEGYNEAGQRPNDFWGNLTGDGLLGGTQKTRTYPGDVGGLAHKDNERAMMTALAPEAPYIVSGTTIPTNSVAANWYQSLGSTSTNQNQFSFANELAAAKAKQASILGNQSAVGWLAVNQSPFYNFLKENKLDKGIL
jgi:hypothetical protein